MTVQKPNMQTAGMTSSSHRKPGEDRLEIDFFFDCTCVWAYLAFEQLKRFADEMKLRLVLRPVVVSEVFAVVNPAVGWGLPPVKDAYYEKDLMVWADYLDLPLVAPAKAQIDARDAMLACAGAVRWGRATEFATALFQAAWTQGRDISDADTLSQLWQDVGLPSGVLAETLAWPDVAEDLRANNRELMERGGFGVPTYFLGDEMFFGNDSFPLLQEEVFAALRSAGYAL